MTRKKKTLSSWEKLRDELLLDPETKEEYDKLEPEFAIIREIMRYRIEHDITQKEFYLDGQLKSEKHFQEGYEEGEQNPVGEWKYFNKQGKVIRTEKYKMMYNKK